MPQHDDPLPRHRHLPHTGEVAIELEAERLCDLFAEAARALAALLTEDVHGPSPGERESVELRGRDAAALLVAWLDELIARSELAGRIYNATTLEVSQDGRHLAGEVSGRSPQAWRTQVKAATMHDLVVEQRDGGWYARVVLDV